MTGISRWLSLVSTTMRMRQRQEALWTLKTVLIQALKLLHPYMPFITEEIFCNIQDEEESIMISKWPEYTDEWNFEADEAAVDTIKAKQSVPSETFVQE